MPYKNKEEQRKYLREWRARKKVEKLKPKDNVETKVETKVETEETEVEPEEEPEEINREPNVKQPEESDTEEEESEDEEIIPSTSSRIPSTKEKMPFWQFFLVAAGVPIITGILSNFGTIFSGVSEYLKKKPCPQMPPAVNNCSSTRSSEEEYVINTSVYGLEFK